jgi:membrane protease YdiL (CAAX protease family)
MFAPAIASVVVAKLADRTCWRDAVGLRFRGKWRVILLWSPLATLLVLALNVATAVIMVLRGVRGDLTGSTWATELSRTFSAPGAEMPVGAAVALMLAITAIGLLVTVAPALGEEIGWRGWLRRELAPLGPWAAIVLGGAIWSLWHLPVTLLGHNCTGQPRWAAVAMFIPACIALNYLFSAITARAGGNPIPAAFAHATLNSTLGVAVSVVATSETMAGLNWFLDLPTGLTGIVIITVAAFLVMPRTGRAGSREDG